MSCRFLRRGVAGWIALLLVLPGCASPRLSGAPVEGEAPESAAPVVSPVPAAREQQVTLYFPHATKPLLVREARTVTRRGEQPEWRAMQELLRGPQTEAARPVLAKTGAAGSMAGAYGVYQPKLFDGTVALMVSEQTAAELARPGGLLSVYAVVHTLTASSARVKKVSFRVDGRPGPLIVEGVDLTQPLAPRPELVEAKDE